MSDHNNIRDKEWVKMSMPKDDLHRLIEALPEKEIPAVRRFVEFILSKNWVEDSDWLNADLAELPPYDWGPEGPPKGKPVRYSPETGFIIEGK
jgi:hypothetical protein